MSKGCKLNIRIDNTCVNSYKLLSIISGMEKNPGKVQDIFTRIKDRILEAGMREMSGKEFKEMVKLAQKTTGPLSLITDTPDDTGEGELWAGFETGKTEKFINAIKSFSGKVTLETDSDEGWNRVLIKGPNSVLIKMRDKIRASNIIADLVPINTKNEGFTDLATKLNKAGFPVIGEGGLLQDQIGKKEADMTDADGEAITDDCGCSGGGTEKKKKSCIEKSEVLEGERIIEGHGSTWSNSAASVHAAIVEALDDARKNAHEAASKLIADDVFACGPDCITFRGLSFKEPPLPDPSLSIERLLKLSIGISGDGLGIKVEADTFFGYSVTVYMRYQVLRICLPIESLTPDSAENDNTTESGENSDNGNDVLFGGHLIPVTCSDKSASGEGVVRGDYFFVCNYDFKFSAEFKREFKRWAYNQAFDQAREALSNLGFCNSGCTDKGTSIAVHMIYFNKQRRGKYVSSISGPVGYPYWLEAKFTWTADRRCAIDK